MQPPATAAARFGQADFMRARSPAPSIQLRWCWPPRFAPSTPAHEAAAHVDTEAAPAQRVLAPGRPASPASDQRVIQASVMIKESASGSTWIDSGYAFTRRPWYGMTCAFDIVVISITTSMRRAARVFELFPMEHYHLKSCRWRELERNKVFIHQRQASRCHLQP